MNDSIFFPSELFTTQLTPPGAHGCRRGPGHEESHSFLYVGAVCHRRNLSCAKIHWLSLQSLSPCGYHSVLTGFFRGALRSPQLHSSGCITQPPGRAAADPRVEATRLLENFTQAVLSRWCLSSPPSESIYMGRCPPPTSWPFSSASRGSKYRATEEALLVPESSRRMFATSSF